MEDFEGDKEFSCCESWAFSIPALDMEHDEGVYTLGLDVCYQYVAGIREGEYPDWRPIADDIREFLAHYPESTHYWEVVNKRLVTFLLRKYRVLAVLTVVIRVPPLCSNALPRTTTVTLARPGYPAPPGLGPAGVYAGAAPAGAAARVA